MDIRKMLKEILDEKKKDQKVLRTVMGKPEWKKIWEEHLVLRKEIEEQVEKLEFLHRKFWTTVEEDLDCYSPMSYNHGINAVNILEREGDAEKRKEEEDD